LKHLDQFCQKRSQFAKIYFELLKSDDILTLPAYSDPKYLPGDKFDDGHAWHIFSPLINFKKIKISREEFIKKMNSEKIGIGVHYPAVHSFTAYKKMGFKAKDFPHAQKIGDNTISLPLFPTMKSENVEYVCKTLKKIIYK
ncbi:MAG: DegT/DnrJ/EryC1/StrS family aminotransferase, partial [Bdellovibrionales bacterium]